MNSQITFDEYLLISTNNFVYQAKYNPEIIYQYELDTLHPDDADYEERAPEKIV